MCTRTLYVGDDGFVATGRNMDWKEDMFSNLWVFPVGCRRSGAAGPNSLSWTSRYGSVATSGYEAGTPDGLNEKGLAANALYLVESEYGAPRADRLDLSISLWTQYVLDMYATVAEAVEGLRAEPFNVLAPVLPNGAPAALHLAVSDASGDSAIFEYVGGVLTIHHGRAYKVMTNSPTYDQQLALDAYWRQVGGLVFLPGTNRAADRFARASFLLDALPKKIDPHYIWGIPGQTYAHQALAAVLSLQRAVSVPLGISTEDQPNISSTIWRTVCDHRNLIYCFDSATRPNTFWVDLAKLDFTPGAPIRKLSLEHGEVYAGEVSERFVPADELKWLPAG